MAGRLSRVVVAPAVLCGAIAMGSAPVRAAEPSPEGEVGRIETVERLEVKRLRDPALMPYKDAYDMLSKFEKSGKYPALELKVAVASKNKAVKPGDIVLRLVGDTLDLPIPVDAAGRVAIPVLPEALADNAEIISNQPKNSLQARINIVGRLAPAREYRYRELMTLVTQSEQAIREFVPWYMRWLIPTLSAVQFTFPEGVAGEVTLRFADRTETLAPLEPGKVLVPVSKVWMESDPQVLLSVPASGVEPTVWQEPKSARAPTESG